MLFNVLQIIGIFGFSWFGFIAFFKAIHKNDVSPGNIILMAVSIALIFVKIVFV